MLRQLFRKLFKCSKVRGKLVSTLGPKGDYQSLAAWEADTSGFLRASITLECLEIEPPLDCYKCGVEIPSLEEQFWGDVVYCLECDRLETLRFESYLKWEDEHGELQG